MKKIMLACLLIAGTMLFSEQAVAQKFGYLNSNAILAEMPEVQQANANLDALRKQLQKKGQQMLQNLQTKYQDVQQRVERGELSPKQQEEEGQKLQAEEQNIAKFEQDMISQLKTKEAELLQPILDKVNDAIAAVAKEDGYTYIFDSSVGILLYADDSTDVSDKVKSKLGIQ